MNREELLRKIQELSFAKCEMELFFDTHPTCRAALDMYRSTVDELNMATERYQNEFGPLTADGSMGTDRWTWIDSPWPWHLHDDIAPRGGNS